MASCSILNGLVLEEAQDDAEIGILTGNFTLRMSCESFIATQLVFATVDLFAAEDEG